MMMHSRYIDTSNSFRNALATTLIKLALRIPARRLRINNQFLRPIAIRFISLSTWLLSIGKLLSLASRKQVTDLRQGLLKLCVQRVNLLLLRGQYARLQEYNFVRRVQIACSSKLLSEAQQTFTLLTLGQNMDLDVLCMCSVFGVSYVDIDEAENLCSSTSKPITIPHVPIQYSTTRRHTNVSGNRRC